MSKSPYTNLDLQEISNRNEEAARVLAGFSAGMPSLPEIWRFLETALADVPVLSAEVTRLAGELKNTRLDRANLLAAARATISAHADGETDPLSYVRDELNARQALPPNSGRRA